MKSASMRGVVWPWLVAMGSISSSVPTAMRTAKPRTSTKAGEGGRRTRFGGATWYSRGFSRPTRTRRSPGFWPGRMRPALPRPALPLTAGGHDGMVR